MWFRIASERGDRRAYQKRLDSKQTIWPKTVNRHPVTVVFKETAAKKYRTCKTQNQNGSVDYKKFCLRLIIASFAEYGAFSFTQLVSLALCNSKSLGFQYQSCDPAVIFRLIARASPSGDIEDESGVVDPGDDSIDVRPAPQVKTATRSFS